MGTLVDNGGCYFDGQIKNWLFFRHSLCHGSDGTGLGWVQEIANVLTAYLQKVVADMSNKEREAGGVDTDTDFSKFSDTGEKGRESPRKMSSLFSSYGRTHQASERHFWVELHGPCQMRIRQRGRSRRNS